jgi:photosystem II stability/assembly factor-like uncharacterized protein
MIQFFYKKNKHSNLKIKNMKKVTLLFLLISSIGFSQSLQNNAPWMQNAEMKNKSNLKLEDIEKSARAFFETVDKNKKGSGLKPFERWNYHWKHYTNQDGTLSTSKDLWSAWKQKNNMKKAQSSADINNWQALGPFQSSNTYSSPTMKSSGQGRVNVVAVDPSNPNTYYIGAPAGGIWKSTDAGVTWKVLTDYLPQIGVSGIAIDPTNSDIIYIATGDDDANHSYSVGVYKSIDGGTTWNATGAMAGNPDSMNEIYFDPNDNNTLLIATSSGVFKTTDAGTTWTNKLNGNIRDLKMKPGDATTWYAVSSSTFYKSLDSGETFTSVSIFGLSGSARIVIEVTPADSNYVYVLSSGPGPSYSFRGLFKSTDSGTSFTKTAETDDIFASTQAWYDLALTVSDVNPDIVYVGVLDIWRSTDGGDDFSKLTFWNQPDTPSFCHADIHFMRFYNGTLFVGSDGGIYKSENNGDNFSDLTEGVSISQFYKISVSQQNSNIVAGGLQDNGGFSYNGDSWTNYHGGDGMEGIVSPVNQNIHYGFIQYGGILFGTENKGNSLTISVDAPSRETGTGDSGGEWVTPLASNSVGEMYAGYSQLYKLVDGAWTNTNPDQFNTFNFGGDLDQLEIDPQNDNNIYVSNGSLIWKSSDAGVSFTAIPFVNGNINNIEVNNNDSNIAWLATNNGVFKTTNMLAETPTFTNISGNLPSDSKLAVKHHARSNNNSIYIGTTLGVYHLNDDITDWVAFDTNLPNVSIRDLEINENEALLYAGTFGRGIFTTGISVALPAKDVRFVSIDEPTNGISCSNEISPKVTVKNSGSDAITSITVNYNIDGGANNVYNWSGSINSEDTAVISLPSSTTSLGVHNLNVEVTITDDAYDTNNIGSSSFIVNASSVSPTTINTFESSTSDNLVIETQGNGGVDEWQLGAPSGSLLNTTASGANVYGTNLDGNHADATTSYLYTNCYDVSNIGDPILKFQMAFDIEKEWDYLLVEYSTDLGANWSILGSGSDANWYTSSATTNDSGQASLPGKQWTGLGEETHPNGGTNADLHEYSYDLTAFTSESNMIFRFAFFADANTNEEGVIIDDLVIEGRVLSTENFEFSNSISIAPNPSSGLFTINSPTLETLSIQVFDITGKSILLNRNVTTINGKYSFDINKYAKGLYFLKVSADGKQTTKKIILV